MQRKPSYYKSKGIAPRNISAHAEKTGNREELLRLFQKHLCACRENEYAPSDHVSFMETSLRMQRKLTLIVSVLLTLRNISAHAEKTSSKSSTTSKPQKHLCACRENPCLDSLALIRRETSLRMQRKRKIKITFSVGTGNISAHAEKTKQGKQMNQPT